MISGLLKAALLEGDAADLVQGGCLGGAVTGAAGGTQRVAEDDECLGVVAASAKVAGGGGGQPGGAAGPAVRSGMHGNRHQRGAPSTAANSGRQGIPCGLTTTRYRNNLPVAGSSPARPTMFMYDSG